MISTADTMRPALLNPLFEPLANLPGIGPRLLPKLARLVGPAPTSGREAVVADLLFHLPVQAIDRTRESLIAAAPEGAIVTLRVRVDRHRPVPAGSRAPYRVAVHDESGELTLAWFHAERSWIENMLPVGAERLVSGRVEWFNGAPQMTHPDHVVPVEEAHRLPRIEPVYPMTAGLAPKVLRKAVDGALARLPALPEWQDPSVMAREGWPDIAGALARLHRPELAAEVAPSAPARLRLAYDELLASQLALALVRASMRARPGRARHPDGSIQSRLRAGLPFSLTGAQERAIADILADLAAPARMVRLVQGDVGAGKTMVALFAAAAVAETGGQTAVMAPTELLARQHAKSMEKAAASAGLTVTLLTGEVKGKARREVLADVESGAADIVVGTHALFQGDVAFRDLALAVVDEQHRFGVEQRLALTTKGTGVDLLVMTATPIPRTLLMAHFGDMDISRLDEKPPGRKPITTRTLPLDRLEEVVDGLARAMAAGARAYWVCPMVEENETLDLAAAEERSKLLGSVFGDRVTLVHGRMKAAEKAAAMERFVSGSAQLLVATTVIEVGVDVPEATIIVVEHAERFGLAQLHQLRGRVGRGSGASHCLLLYKAPLGETARARLSILRDSEDGFLIAEEDLRLRGGGEILGTRQSGLPGQRFEIPPEETRRLVEIARDDAALALARDPALAGERGAALRCLLHLFGKDEAVRLIRAG